MPSTSKIQVFRPRSGNLSSSSKKPSSSKKTRKTSTESFKFKSSETDLFQLENEFTIDSLFDEYTQTVHKLTQLLLPFLSKDSSSSHQNDLITKITTALETLHSLTHSDFLALNSSNQSTHEIERTEPQSSPQTFYSSPSSKKSSRSMFLRPTPSSPQNQTPSSPISITSSKNQRTSFSSKEPIRTYTEMMTEFQVLSDRIGQNGNDQFIGNHQSFENENDNENSNYIKNEKENIFERNKRLQYSVTKHSSTMPAKKITSPSSSPVHQTHRKISSRISTPSTLQKSSRAQTPHSQVSLTQQENEPRTPNPSDFGLSSSTLALLNDVARKSQKKRLKESKRQSLCQRTPATIQTYSDKRLSGSSMQSGVFSVSSSEASIESALMRTPVLASGKHVAYRPRIIDTSQFIAEIKTCTPARTPFTEATNKKFSMNYSAIRSKIATPSRQYTEIIFEPGTPSLPSFSSTFPQEITEDLTKHLGRRSLDP